MVPWVHATPRHLNRFSRFCTAQDGRFLYFTMGRPFPPNCLFPLGDLDPIYYVVIAPTRVIKPKRHIDRLSHFCTAHLRVSLGMPGRPLPAQSCPFAWRIWTPSNTCFPGPIRVHNPNGISIGSAVFDSSRQSVVGDIGACHFPLKLPLSMVVSEPHLTRGSLFHSTQHPKRHLDRVSRSCTAHGRQSLYFTKMPIPTGGSGPPSNTLFPGPTRVHNAHGISIGSAICAGLTMTDRQAGRQTDHITRSVTIGRIYVSSTAMRPNNNKYLSPQGRNFRD